jgi:hypothetical protein
MRCVFCGLAMISLLMCSSAFAGDVPNADSNGSPKLQKASSPAQLRHPKNYKQVSKTRPDGRSGSSSLSSAAAYVSEHSASLPISSAPRSAPPSTNSWTGFHVGVGAGMTQP